VPVVHHGLPERVGDRFWGRFEVSRGGSAFFELGVRLADEIPELQGKRRGKRNSSRPPPNRESSMVRRCSTARPECGRRRQAESVVAIPVHGGCWQAGERTGERGGEALQICRFCVVSKTVIRR
jgi:hypothetical protein